MLFIGRRTCRRHTCCARQQTRYGGLYDRGGSASCARFGKFEKSYFPNIQNISDQR